MRDKGIGFGFLLGEGGGFGHRPHVEELSGMIYSSTSTLSCCFPLYFTLVLILVSRTVNELEAAPLFPSTRMQNSRVTCHNSGVSPRQSAGCPDLNITTQSITRLQTLTSKRRRRKPERRANGCLAVAV